MPVFGAQAGHLNLPRVPHLSEIVGFVHRNVLAQDAPTATLVRRTPASAPSSAATAACTDSSMADTCAKPTDTSLGLPIGLGVAIPLAAAAIILAVLHQRNKKRQRLEDRRDEEKYKSLDFGTSLHFSDGKRKKKGGNALQDGGPVGHRQMRGLSMEAGPYIFPDNLHDSRASLHSMSRNAAFEEFSPYRPADEISLRAASPGPRIRGDNGSIASSTLRRKDVPLRADSTNSSNTNLLRHPQPPPKSLPPVPGGIPNSPYLPSPDSFEKSPLVQQSKEFGTGNVGLAPPPAPKDRDSYFEKGARDMRQSTTYLGAFIHSREPSTDNRNKNAQDSELFFDENPSSHSGSNIESTGSTLVNNSPNQTTPKASITEYDAPKITPSDYDSMPHAMSQPPEAPPKDNPLPSAKTLPSAKSLPSTPRPARKQSLEQTQQAPPTPPKEQRRTSPKPQPQPNENQLNRYSEQSQADHYSNHRTNSYVSDSSNYGDYPPRDSSSSYHSAGNKGFSSANPMPVLEEYPQPPPVPQDWEVDGTDHDPRRVSVFMRPLPPEDPNDTPEVRANRIRSFYKEYFEQGGYDGGNQQYPQAGPSDYQLPPGEYYDYEDYTQEYMNAATVYDPQAGGFVVSNAPYAEPVTRRAMTPPPRAPPRFRGNGPPSVSSSRPGSRQASNQAWNMPPRGQSAMSYRGRAAQRKPMPPPTALMSLPTPHLLKADSVLTALDFAPPVSFRDRQAGRRPDSPLGMARPYSPSVRAHVPLASSFDDLAVIPSPHALRKSGVYTSLDFAPPRRFKNDDGMSDAGSIRSGRSGMSTVSSQQLYAMRTGAYRVSRIPKELAGSKDDIISSLRPTWDLRGPEQAARNTGRESPAAFSTLRFT